MSTLHEASSQVCSVLGGEVGGGGGLLLVLPWQALCYDGNVCVCFNRIILQGLPALIPVSQLMDVACHCLAYSCLVSLPASRARWASGCQEGSLWPVSQMDAGVMSHQHVNVRDCQTLA